MSLSSLIGAQIPLLRRYARALSGSQESGDAYVSAVLEALLADPSIFDREADPREETYRLFTRLWNAMPINGRAGQASDVLMPPTGAWRRSRPCRARPSCSPRSKASTPTEAARVLGVDRGGIRAADRGAGREIDAEVATNVLIIEDEPLIAMDIESLVEGSATGSSASPRTRAEAVALARATRPGLVLADIQLADGSSGPRRGQGHPGKHATCR